MKRRLLWTQSRKKQEEQSSHNVEGQKCVNDCPAKAFTRHARSFPNINFPFWYWRGRGVQIIRSESNVFVFFEEFAWPRIGRSNITTFINFKIHVRQRHWSSCWLRFMSHPFLRTPGVKRLEIQRSICNIMQSVYSHKKFIASKMTIQWSEIEIITNTDQSSSIRSISWYKDDVLGNQDKHDVWFIDQHRSTTYYVLTCAIWMTRNAPVYDLMSLHKRKCSDGNSLHLTCWGDFTQGIRIDIEIHMTQYVLKYVYINMCI